MYDLEPVGPARIIFAPFRRTQCSPEGQAADAAHAIDADAHDVFLFLLSGA